MSQVTGTPVVGAPAPLEKKPVKFSNLLLGAGLNLFEVTTLGQPLEVMKTTMAANRKDGMSGSVARIWSRGGVLGCKLTSSLHKAVKITASIQADRNLPLAQSTKVSFPGPGSKPPPRAPSFSSSPQKPSTTPRASAPTTSVPA